MLFFKKKDIPLNKVFPKGFTDIHSHLLPGIDDGAKTMADSIKLIKKFKTIGVANLITTPHIMGSVWPNTSEIILKKLADVKQALIDNNITDIYLYAAAEYLIDENFVALLKKKDLLCLKDNMVLVEMSYFNPPFNLFEILFNMQVAEYKPVLAHPERYSFYHEDHAQYDKLKQAGCLFQLNLLSLTKHYGERVQQTALQLLKKGYYDFVGTDVHRLQHLEILKQIGHDKLQPLLKPLMDKNLFFAP